MTFYSGFCLRDEARFFAPWLRDDAYTLAGFSSGAIKAFEHALASRSRIDTLQLFSPAFFGDKSEAFKRLQLRGFERNRAGYLQQFIAGCFAPYPIREIRTKEEGAEDLEKLLSFPWNPAELQRLTARGVRIEVYLGTADAIIDAEAARAHFLPYATLYTFKNANHFLQGENNE